MWNLRDKICVVTGASSGIGKESALGLAKQGARVAIVCRDRDRANEAATAIRAAGSPHVEVFLADLSRQADVRRVADEICQRLTHIDVLLHNVGAVMRRHRMTVDGIESTFALNHLAPFLLNHLVRDKLAQPSRVIVVASQVEARGHLDFDDLHFEHTRYEPLAAYDRSKLANVLFTYELARRLGDADVTANCLHPGVIATNLLCDYMGRPRLMNKVHRLTHPGPEEGAQVSLKLAIDPELAGVSGRYFRPEGEASSSKQSYDPELARRLWEVSERLTGIQA